MSHYDTEDERRVLESVLEYTENEMVEPELGYLSKQDICSLLLRFRFRFRGSIFHVIPRNINNIHVGRRRANARW